RAVRDRPRAPRCPSRARCCERSRAGSALTTCTNCPDRHRFASMARRGRMGTAHQPAILKLSDVRSNIAELVNRVHYRGERVIVGRAGKALAALIPVRDLELLERLLEEAENLSSIAEDGRLAAGE